MIKQQILYYILFIQINHLENEFKEVQMAERSPKQRLYWLIDLVRNEKIEIPSFCNEFHITYDHDSDIDEFSTLENQCFGELARLSARFSEFEDDLKRYPNVYSSEKEIRDKVSEVIQVLGI
ncbi:hypothetical protein SAM19_04905 [Brevibacillus laterosporus]|nr:hypothetical protein [Brevibacillus laterosporus]